jgi:hypothetical protein
MGGFLSGQMKLHRNIAPEAQDQRRPERRAPVTMLCGDGTGNLRRRKAACRGVGNCRFCGFLSYFLIYKAFSVKITAKLVNFRRESGGEPVNLWSTFRGGDLSPLQVNQRHPTCRKPEVVVG